MLRGAALGAIALGALAAGCGSSGSFPDKTTVDAALRERITHGVRLDDDAALPAGVNPEDGPTTDAFQERVTDTQVP